MKTQTHTPGPWSVGCEDLGGEALCYKVYGKDNQKIATVGRWNSVGDHANARLIASAPELLEIAYAYRNLLKSMSQSDGEVATFNYIESVLAKAEGRI
ncbi:MAG: hypothetical protein IPN19_12700 [Elusimicrobia bacterium]|nr:hypothetical protein [Elusimicrobiota bacterium]